MTENIIISVATLVAGLTVGLLVSFLVKRVSARWQERVVIEYLKKFFTAADCLESAYKDLATFLVRDNGARENFSRIIKKPDMIRAGEISSASTLLSEGKGIEEVATKLKLPLSQVRLVDELRQRENREESTSHRENIAAGKNGYGERVSKKTRIKGGIPSGMNNAKLDRTKLEEVAQD